MKIFALAFIMALMFAMIGAGFASRQARYPSQRNEDDQNPKKGGFIPYPSQSNSQEYPWPILYGGN